MADNTENTDREFYFSLASFGEFLGRIGKYVKEEKVNEFMDEFFALLRDISKEAWRLLVQENKCFDCAFYEVMNADAFVKRMEEIRKKYTRKEAEKELMTEELTYIK